MSEERKRILKMLAEGKISADEAEELLDALSTGSKAKETEGQETKPKGNPKFIVVKVTPKKEGGDHVNIKVPMMLVKAGMKISSVLPQEAQDKIGDKLKEKGIDINLKDITSGNIDGIFGALMETSIDVDDEDEHVRIYCE